MITGEAVSRCGAFASSLGRHDASRIELHTKSWLPDVPRQKLSNLKVMIDNENLRRAWGSRLSHAGAGSRGIFVTKAVLKSLGHLSTQWPGEQQHSVT